MIKRLLTVHVILQGMLFPLIITGAHQVHNNRTMKITQKKDLKGNGKTIKADRSKNYLWGKPRQEPFLLGIENINKGFLKEYRGKKIALVTNHTGVDQKKNRTVDLLIAKGLSVMYICCPEHGFDGTKGAAEDIDDGIDAKTGIKIISLYRQTSKRIPAAVLNDVEVIMFDIQDCGMRHYTYISTLHSVMESASNAEKIIVVFDRPNPLGLLVEGPLVEDKYRSFISIANIPLRHGMTIGELARYFNTHEFSSRAHLHVVPMSGYNRDQPFNLVVPLSPGLSSLQACYGYSFLGLVGEIKPFGIGLRTDKKFAFFGFAGNTAEQITEKAWLELQEKLKKHGLGATYTDCLDPQGSKLFKGLHIRIDSISHAHSFKALVEILSHLKEQGIQFKFSRDFNYAVGNPLLKNFIEGRVHYNELAMVVNKRLKEFIERAQGSFLYQPVPTLSLLEVADGSLTEQ